MTEQLITKLIEKFAQSRIATQTDLAAAQDIPLDLWQDLLAAAELHSSLSLMQAIIALTEHGGYAGISLAYLVHQLLLKFLPPEYQQIPRLCLAVSEPDVGAHPKYLKTSARHVDGAYLLTGQKSYLTNYTSGAYLVLAITDQIEERKFYSAFLVKSEGQGLQRTAPMDLPILKPVMHGGIIMQDCPAEALIGNQGCAYEEIAIPFRQLEEIFMLGIICGLVKQLTGRVERQLVDLALSAASKLDQNTGAADLLEPLSFADCLAQIKIAQTGDHEFMRLKADFDGLLKLGRRSIEARRQRLS